MLTVRLDRDSGLPAYVQISAQVREAVRFGWLEAGEQLPTVRDVAAGSGVNPNTVLRAYRDLAAEGVLEMRQGSGTFVADRALRGTEPALLLRFRARLERWVTAATEAGLTEDDLRALLSNAGVELRAASA